MQNHIIRLMHLINQTIFNCFPRIEIFRTIYVFLKSFNGFTDTLRENIELRKYTDFYRIHETTSKTVLTV